MRPRAVGANHHGGRSRACEAIRTEQREVGVVHHALEAELADALGEPLGVAPRDDRDRQLAVTLDASGVLERRAAGTAVRIGEDERNRPAGREQRLERQRPPVDALAGEGWRDLADREAGA